MASYLVLANFTDQGLRNIKDTARRAEAVREMAKTFGIEAKAFFWTQGPYDIVAIFEAPNDSSVMALDMVIAQAGNVRGQTLRAFTQEEVAAILAKLP